MSRGRSKKWWSSRTINNMLISKRGMKAFSELLLRRGSPSTQSVLHFEENLERNELPRPLVTHTACGQRL